MRAMGHVGGIARESRKVYNSGLASFLPTLEVCKNDNWIEKDCKGFGFTY
jgi:hypothetical protein